MNRIIIRQEVFLNKMRSKHVYCPTLALAECAAAIARQTGNSTLARELVSLIEDFPGMNLVSLDPPLARRAAKIAISNQLGGADAVYVAVAEVFDATLISWDLEMLKRSPDAVKTLNPSQWLDNKERK